MGGGQSHNQQGPQGPSSSHGPNNGSVLATKKQQHENANKCSPAKVKSCLRTFFAHLFSHIGLCILIVGYTIAGALMFEKLEKTYEMKLIGNRTANFKKLRLHYVSELWNITGKQWHINVSINVLLHDFSSSITGWQSIELINKPCQRNFFIILKNL